MPAVVESLDGQHNIVEEVAAFIERFVFLKHRSLYMILALWTINTHMYERFQYVATLFLSSPERQCGKTRLLEILHMLVANSSGINCSPTPAVLFRTAHKCTQLLDEADGWHSISDVQSVINAGYERNGTTKRMEPTEGGGYVVRDFPVFAPRAIAGIGDILTDTMRDRTLMIQMTRQTRSERRHKLRQRHVQPEADALKARIETWVEEHGENIQTAYDAKPTFDHLEQYADRTIDICEPLAVILEEAYSGDPNLARARTTFTEAIALTREEKNTYGQDHEILRAISQLMGDDAELLEQPTVIAEKCQQVGIGEFSVEAISDTLRRYRFPVKSARIGPDEAPRKCYAIRREPLKEVLDRYAS